MPPVKITFLVIAVVFAGVAAMEYRKGGGKMPLRGKIFVRMAIIFALVSVYLFWHG